MIWNHQTGFAAVTALALLISLPAFAEKCPTLDPVLLSTLLMPPPADDSEESIAEFHELQDLETLRTREQAEHAGDDHKESIARFLGEIGITIGGKPTVALDFFKCITDSADKAVNEAKRTFSRTRPYKYPNNYLPVLKEIGGDDSPSYPSGHATYGMVVGLVLADMLPEKKEEIIRRIEDFGYSRLVSGVHFRSDVYAGQIAGAAIVASFFKDDEFRNQFGDARKDLRKALGYPPQ